MISPTPLAHAYELSDGSLLVPTCPYCGAVHQHGRGEGWRYSHCRQEARPYYLIRSGSVDELDPRQARCPA